MLYNMSQGQLIIFTAPSGAGKTTIVRHLLKRYPQLAFSISATTRAKRSGEVDGKDYYFLSHDAFRQKVADDAFVEWEEVYPGQYYGTLKSEVERLWALDKVIIFDIDVKGAARIKEYYPQALAVFVQPPSPAVLRNRLEARGTETEATLKKRMARFAEELRYVLSFDTILINDYLPDTLLCAEQLVESAIPTLTPV